ITVPATINPHLSYTIVATVTAAAPGGGVLDGTVTFFVDGSQQAVVGLNGAGQAGFTFTNPFLDGTHSITAKYSGSASYNPNSASANTTVVPFSNQIYAVGAGPGSTATNGTPAIKVYDALTGAERASFYAYAAPYGGGVRVAVADVNGDGYADIITGT